MRSGRFLSLATAALAAFLACCETQTVCDLGGPLCSEKVKPGRCLSAGDCQLPLVCDQDASSATFHQCVPAALEDAGERDGSIPDGATDGQPEDALPACVGSGDCKDPSQPVCATGGVCTRCEVNAQCEARGGPEGLCNADTGRCVVCLDSKTCPSDAPVCADGSCVACNSPGAAGDGCLTRDPGKPICAAGGTCVECAANNDCGVTAKPICESGSCRSCQADQECTAEPGVCMSHEDGRCATPNETVYVENLSGKCMNAAQAGTLATPFCGLQEGVTAAAGAGKSLVVLHGPKAVFGAAYAGPAKLSLVGKGGALVAPGAATGLSVSGGELYIRGVTIKGGTEAGVSVTGAGTALRLEQSSIVDNAGGGVLVENGRLLLSNCLIARNGPGFAGTTAWGGILLNQPAAGTRIERTSITDNKAPGMLCSTAVQGMGVLATGNSTVEISPVCGFSACVAAGPMCGSTL